MNKNDEEKKWMTLEEASKLLTTPNGHVSKQTLWRWATTGCRGIRLKTMRFGRRIYVTEKDLEGFSRELAENWDCSRYYDTSESPCRKRAETSATRDKRIAKAERYLNES